jgi:protoporphyrinogen oxidase
MPDAPTAGERKPSATELNSFVKNYGPIDRLSGETAPLAFSGDNNARPHSILWNLDQYLATHTPHTEIEKAPMVIIGGGMSGLFTAYEYRKHQPIVLEQALRFGGNAKGQQWRDLTYSIGAAYIDLPRPGTPMRKFYDELGLESVLVGRPTSDPAEYNGKIYANFWEGETEPKSAKKYEKMNSFFSSLCKEQERPFPFIPALNQGQFDSVKYYDRYSLHALLSKVVGGHLPPHLETALEYYCWSTYAASAKEISASAALNFLAQESNPIRIGAGGNARIGEVLLERLVHELPTQNLRTQALVVKVKVHDDHAEVWYEDAEKKLRRIHTRCVVMCCPKFVAAKFTEELESERLAAIQKIKYRSYMTANLLLKKKPKALFYDLFMTGDGKPKYGNLEKWQDNVNATDFVLANFADRSASGTSLTFYRAFPVDGMRGQLNAPEAYGEYRKKFEEQIAKSVLPLLELSQADVADLRLTLWGHALPVATPGLYGDGTIEQLRKPFKGRVIFVEQDNWLYPSTQTGATDTILLQGDIQRALA